ncbi:60S ribosomal protein L18 [Phytophthora pseudosyringae]|uniref:60S ribosomal protein L18 n=1 Tax=Phytophthora pseudosyringae TaxID=221518 RepID=A0A8T1VBY9_9STRA|nr:60S ribosomal protein L18 [Phytophthora pseudosyringae]
MLRRLYQSNTNWVPQSLGKVARFMQKHESKIAVVVGTVTDDTRLLNTPKLSVAPLNSTESAALALSVPTRDFQAFLSPEQVYHRRQTWIYWSQTEKCSDGVRLT